MEQKRVVRFELKQVLKERDLTYEEFGALMEPQMKKQHVFHLINRSSITFDMLERIMNALEMEPHEVTKIIKVY